MKGGEEQSPNVRGISLSWGEEQQGEFGAPLGDLRASFCVFFERVRALLPARPPLLPPPRPLLSSSSLLLFSPISFPAPAVGSQLSVSLPPSLTPYLPRALLGASGLLRRGRMSHRESPPAPSPPPPPLLAVQRRDVDGEDGPERAEPLSDTEREMIRDAWGHVYKNCEDVGVSILIR